MRIRIALLSTAAAIASLSIFGSNAKAQQTPQADSRISASYFAAHLGTIAYVAVNAGFQGTPTGTTPTSQAPWVSEYVQMNPKFETYYASFNGGAGINLGQDTIPGLPFYNGTVQNLYGSVNAYDNAGNWVAYGYLVADNDPTTGVFDQHKGQVRVVLLPGFQNRSVPFTVPAGVNVNNLVVYQGDEVLGFSYDAGSQSFQVGYDPLNPDQSIRIVDNNGNVYLAGNFVNGVFQQTAIPLSVLFAGGAMPLDFGTNGLSQFLGQKLDGNVEMYGTTEPGKSYFADMTGFNGIFDIQGLPQESEVKVETFDSFGKVLSTTYLGYSTQSDGTEYYYQYVAVNGPVVLTITNFGSSMSSTSTFTVRVYRQPISQANAATAAQAMSALVSASQ